MLLPWINNMEQTSQFQSSPLNGPGNNSLTLQVVKLLSYTSSWLLKCQHMKNSWVLKAWLLLCTQQSSTLSPGLVTTLQARLMLDMQESHKKHHKIFSTASSHGLTSSFGVSSSTPGIQSGTPWLMNWDKELLLLKKLTHSQSWRIPLRPPSTLMPHAQMLPKESCQSYKRSWFQSQLGSSTWSSSWSDSSSCSTLLWL